MADLDSCVDHTYAAVVFDGYHLNECPLCALISKVEGLEKTIDTLESENKELTEQVSDLEAAAKEES